MATSLTSLLARRYISSRRKSGFVSVIAWFSILGIMLGVATLIIVTSLMNGIRQEMLSNFIGVDGHIRVFMRGQVIRDYEPVLEGIRLNVPPQSNVVARIEGQVMATGKRGTARGAQVMGVTADTIATKPQLTEAITAESLKRFADGQGVLIGERLAESLGLRQGDAITLISPEGRATAFGTVPRIKAYPIAGTFELGMHALDNSLILMPYDQSLIYFTLSQSGRHPASMIEITLPEGDEAEAVAMTLQQQLGSQYLVYPWQKAHQSVFTALEVQRNVMVIILALIILVAAFNIISSLVMMVKDKQTDIAILRTMGMSRQQIIRLFVQTGMSIGIAGTILGLGLGVIGAAHLESLRLIIEGLTGQKILVENIYFLSTLPTETDPMEVVIIVIVSLLLSFLATIYPAYKAASLAPAEALRHG